MILETLTEELVETGIKAGSKKEVIAKMLEIACRSGKVKDCALAAEDAVAREELSSTGMENGIAIPHAKTDAVDELVACIGITEKGVPFDTIDGKPCQIFIMTLSPKGQGGPHIRFLSEVARLLKDEKRREKMLAAKDSTALLKALAE